MLARKHSLAHTCKIPNASLRFFGALILDCFLINLGRLMSWRGKPFMIKLFMNGLAH